MSRVHVHNLPEEWADTFHYIESWLLLVANAENASIKRLDYRFISDDEMLEENRRLLDHDYFTDIITYGEKVYGRIKGDVIISVDRIRENSKVLNNNELDERDRVLVHGLLHLCGYGDKSAEEELKMRSLEDKYLALRP